MGDLQLAIYTSNIQNGTNHQWTSYCDYIKSMADHISTMDEMQFVDLRTSVVARQYWPTTVYYSTSIGLMFARENGLYWLTVIFLRTT
jgi:hypothetical protein